MTPDLQKLLDYWQRALRLRDWEIVAEYVPNLKVRGRDVYGVCTPCADNRTATIEIRHPDTPPPGVTIDPGQVEDTVIHELLHLWFAPFGTRSPVEVTLEENAVWAIAAALHAHKGTPREQQIARAMVAGSTARARRQRTMIDPILKAALETAAASEEPKAAITELLGKLDQAAPASEPGEMTQTADGATEEQQTQMERRAQVARPRVTAPAPEPLTMPKLLSVLAERDERARLMTANADRLSADQLAFAAELELPKLRRFVGTLPARSAPPGTGGDAGGSVKPSAADASKTKAAGAGGAGGELEELDEKDRRRMRVIEQATDMTPEILDRTRKALETDEAGLLSLERLKAMKKRSAA